MLETELWSGLRHRCKGESLRKQKSPLLWPLRQRPTLQKRNVKRHLAKRHWPEVIRRLNAAYHESDHEKALRSLKTTAAWLERIRIVRWLPIDFIKSVLVRYFRWLDEKETRSELR